MGFRRVYELLIGLIVALFVVPSASAAFPYNAPWLPYADARLVYEVNTAGITSNTADIFVEINIDPVWLQNYVNRWSSICDPAGKYDWFWASFAYASTFDTTERMIEVVSRGGWQTFTVGTCGDVNLPTYYVVRMPNGVLDGNANFANYQHYVYVYFKKPFSEDFYDNDIGLDEYFGASAAGPYFYNTFGWGYVYRVGGLVERNVNITVVLGDGIPSVVCEFGRDVDPVISPLDRFRIVVRVGSNTYIVLNPTGGTKQVCTDIEKTLVNAGLSGTVAISSIGMSVDDGYHAEHFWWWFIPDSIIKEALWSGN